MHESLERAMGEYDETRRALQEGGEAAQIADPVESGLMYVNYPEDVIAAFDADAERWTERAQDIIDWEPGTPR